MKACCKHLQVRHYVQTKMNALNLPSDFNLIEKTTIDSNLNHFVSKLYSKLQHLNSDKLSKCNMIFCKMYTYVYLYMYSKYTAGPSPNYPKCKTILGTRLHCLWECEKIQLLWQNLYLEFV